MLLETDIPRGIPRVFRIPGDTVLKYYQSVGVKNVVTTIEREIVSN